MVVACPSVRGSHIARVSCRLLSRDRELLVVPALAAAAFAVAAGSGILLLRESNAARTDELGFWLVLLTASVLSACVVASSSLFAAERARAGRILGWAALATVVSFVRGRADDRFGTFGRTLSRVGSTTFSAASFLALPVVAFRDVGAIDGLKRSALLVRAARGGPPSADVRAHRVGLLALPALAAIAVVMATSSSPGELVVVGLCGTWTALVLTVTSALTGVLPRRHHR